MLANEKEVCVLATVATTRRKDIRVGVGSTVWLVRSTGTRSAVKNINLSGYSDVWTAWHGVRYALGRTRSDCVRGTLDRKPVTLVPSVGRSDLCAVC